MGEVPRAIQKLHALLQHLDEVKSIQARIRTDLRDNKANKEVCDLGQRTQEDSLSNALPQIRQQLSLSNAALDLRE